MLRLSQEDSFFVSLKDEITVFYYGILNNGHLCSNCMQNEQWLYIAFAETSMKANVCIVQPNGS